jgi:phosphoadenosine phosphosulfate reductase
MTPELAAKVRRSTELLKRAAAACQPLAFATSLSAEDMAVTDIILTEKLPISIFTLETGRLFSETLDMIAKVNERYGYDIETYRPEPAAVETYVRDKGLNAFYESLALRKECCGIRKVEPLNRALTGKAGWVTGQRREQGATRIDLHEEERDEARGIMKFNPIADWTWAEVLEYAAARDVPVNPLHARGYVSIGCEPCTRAIRPGEDPRAGRWWWEQSDSKECGLHVQEPTKTG